MSWHDGEHCRPKEKLNRTLDKLEALEGELTDEVAQISFAQFLAANPTFAAHLLTGQHIYPIQDIMMRAFLQRDFCLAICGRGFSKSWTGAMFAAMYAIFYPNKKIGICSASFRQARELFKYIESFAEKKEGIYLKQCISNISHSPEAWEMKIGSSKIVAIPLGAGDKIRGYRFHVMIIDELLALSEKVITEVIKPFMAVESDPRIRGKVKKAEDKLIESGELKEEDRYVFESNKLIGLTSASYQFEYLYELYENYLNLIFDKNAKNVSHCIFQLSYEVAPDELYSKTTVADAKATASEAQFAREYEARFSDDSGGYYSAKKLNEARFKSGEMPCVEIVGDPEAEYLLAIDPNYDDSDTSDHFAMTLLKLDPEEERGIMVHGYALQKSSLKKKAKYIKYLFDKFNIKYVIVDSAGGKKFISDLNELEILSKPLSTFDAEFDTFSEEELREIKANFSPATGAIAHAQNFNPKWIQKANEDLQANIQRKKILFAAPVEDANKGEFDRMMNLKIPIEDLEYSMGDDHVVKQADFIEHQNSMIDLTISECILIVVKISASGHQSFDLPAHLTKDRKPNRARKDSYSSLLLANWGMRCYFALKKVQERKRSYFTPVFIA